MTKITFEDLPSTNTPLSASNLNGLQDNVETAINANTTAINANTTAINTLDTKVDRNATYSSTETVIGTHNNKPLYRKEITFTTGTGGTVATISNLNELVNLYGSYAGQGNKFPVQFYVSDSFYLRTWVYNSNVVYSFAGYANYTGKIIVEYTKTTD